MNIVFEIEDYMKNYMTLFSCHYLCIMLGGTYNKLLNFMQSLISNEDKFVHQGCSLLSGDFDYLSHKDHELASHQVFFRQSSNKARKHRCEVHKSTN